MLGKSLTAEYPPHEFVSNHTPECKHSSYELIQIRMALNNNMIDEIKKKVNRGRLTLRKQKIIIQLPEWQQFIQ